MIQKNETVAIGWCDNGTTDGKFTEGLIPAGTPIAQAIPIKRDSWKSTFGGDKEVMESISTVQRLSAKFFDGYKNMFRSIKEYK